VAANEILIRDGEIKRFNDRMSEHEVRIGHLNLEKCNLIEKIKVFESKISNLDKEIIKKDTWIA